MQRDDGRILVGLDVDESAEAVLALAQRLATTFDAPLEVVHAGMEVPPALARLARTAGVHLDTEPGEPVEVLRRRLEAPRMRMAVVGCRSEDCSAPAGHVPLGLVEHASVPVVVVPPGTHVGHGPLRDVLVPLDGSREAAAAVESTTKVLAGHGLRVTVAHVFERHRTPRFLDQPHHALDAWGQEFLARHASPDLDLVLRAGRPGDQLLDVVAATAPDLVVLGWSQDLAAGRARTILDLLGASPVPLLLVPADGAGGSAAHPRLAVGGGPDW